MRRALWFLVFVAILGIRLALTESGSPLTKRLNAPDSAIQKIGRINEVSTDVIGGDGHLNAIVTELAGRKRRTRDHRLSIAGCQCHNGLVIRERSDAAVK